MEFDLLVEDTRNKVINTLNESGLPITAIDLLLRDLSITVSNQAKTTINALKSKEVNKNVENKQENNS